jgi:hypothetical protein
MSMASDDLKLPAERQSEVVATAKHILSLARAGRIVAIGYAVLALDESGDFVEAGTNAVWSDHHDIKQGLVEAISTLRQRIDAKGSIIIQ